MKASNSPNAHVSLRPGHVLILLGILPLALGAGDSLATSTRASDHLATGSSLALQGSSQVVGEGLRPVAAVASLPLWMVGGLSEALGEGSRAAGRDLQASGDALWDFAAGSDRSDRPALDATAGLPPTQTETATDPAVPSTSSDPRPGALL